MVNDISILVAKSKPSCTIGKYDPGKFKCERHRAYFELLSVAALDLQFWDCTSMVYSFNKYLLWALAQSFPTDKVQPLKPWISAYSVSCVHERKCVRSQFKVATDPEHKAFLYSNFKSHVSWIAKCIAFDNYICV